MRRHLRRLTKVNATGVLPCEFYCLEKSFVRDVVLKELNAHTVIGQCQNASSHIPKDFVMHATRHMLNLRQSVE